MRITLNELRTLIRSEVRKTLIENAIRNRTPKEIENDAKNYVKELQGSTYFANMTPKGWESHFRKMGTEYKDSLYRQRVYSHLSDEDLIAIALELLKSSSGHSSPG